MHRYLKKVCNTRGKERAGEKIQHFQREYENRKLLNEEYEAVGNGVSATIIIWLPNVGVVVFQGQLQLNIRNKDSTSAKHVSSRCT